MKWLVRAALGLVGAAALGGAGIYLWLHLSLPTVNGTVELPGLSGQVEIRRDPDGIPFIRAAHELDAYRALGFVHAQDRLWQMELLRRTGAGRLSELFGAATLDTDRFLRTLGLRSRAEQSWMVLDASVRAAFAAYAEGVNAYIAAAITLPPEFTMLRVKPEPWHPVDSLVWGRLMAFQLSNNWFDELLRARLDQSLSPARIEALWPGDDPTTAVPVAAHAPGAGAARAEIDALLRHVPDAIRPMRASNLWIIAGARSTTGKPILANDPHLRFSNP
ncbi:MAG: penicillin acylase family protein, partial [Alphaproteobacteria bacterium]|nr:penicillin acylase family protein [Alphaproteobacteria bacterium]